MSALTTPRLMAIFAACFFLVAAATCPLSVAMRLLDAPGLAYTRLHGTIWNGEMAGARWRSFDLGTVRVALSPWALPVGRLSLAVAFDGTGVVTGGGAVALKPGGLTINDLTLSADVADLPILLPMSGKLSLEIAEADLARSGCRVLEGAIRTDALVDRPAGLAWSGPTLAGPLGCLDGAVVVPLKGDTASDSVAVEMRLDHGGSFSLRVDARTPDPALLSALSAIGFVESGGVMTLTQRGRWS